MAFMTTTMAGLASAALAVTMLPALGGDSEAHAGAAAGGCHAVPAAVRLGQSQVSGGQTVSGQVSLTCRASSPVRIHLTAFPGAAVRNTVLVPAGRRTASFVVTTSADQIARAGRVLASRRGHRAGAHLTVDPVPTPGQGCADPVLTGVALPPSVNAGDHGTATVTLSCATRVARTVDLSSGPRLGVPSQVTVPAGATAATFPYTVSSQPGDRTTQSVAATSRGVTVSSAVVVDPGLRRFYWQGGDTPYSIDKSPRVELTGGAPEGGVLLHLVSDHPEIIESHDMLLPAGTSDAAIWLEAWLPDVPTTVTMTVTLGTTTLHITTLSSPYPPVSGIQLDQLGRTVLRGGDFFDLRAAMHTPAPTELHVDLTSDHPELLPSGYYVFMFPGDYGWEQTIHLGQATETTTLTVAGTVREAPAYSDTVTYTVQPSVKSVDVVDPVVSGQPFTLTVHMWGPANVDQPVTVDQNESSVVHCTQPGVLPAGAVSFSVQCVGQTSVAMYPLIEFDFPGYSYPTWVHMVPDAPRPAQLFG